MLRVVSMLLAFIKLGASKSGTKCIALCKWLAKLCMSKVFENFSRDVLKCQATLRLNAYRLSPVSWSIRVTGIFRSRSSWGDSFDCCRDKSSECAASRLRASFDRAFVALDLINDEVVVVCTSGMSRELLDDGLADPVDNSSFWASLFSFIFTPSSPSSAAARREEESSWVTASNREINDSGGSRSIEIVDTDGRLQ